MKSFTVDKNLRLVIAGIFVSLLVLTLFASLFYHQIFRHKYFFEQSENNRIRVQPVVPKRGIIYDRHREVIVDNRLSFTLSIVPNERIEGVTIPQLSQLLDMDSAAIEKKAAGNYVGRYIPSAIRRGMNIDVVSILEEQGQAYPGVTYSAESVRRYEDSVSAGTFVGYVGEVSSEEKKSEQYKDYRLGSLIGKKGIEKNYDRQLRGIEGTDFIEVSADGRLIGIYEDKEGIPPVPGAEIVLTIDKELQRFIVSNFDNFQCCGSVVAIDPRNGEILGLAAFPNFDPNIFSGVIPPDVWQNIVSDTNHPLLNRPLAGLYPPGSTTKLLTAGAALESGVITEEYLLKSCFGVMQFGNRPFRCWDPGGHGKLNLYHAIEQSCDVYFYQVGQMLGVDTWAEYARKCGFGRKTGVDIPGELAGLVPDSDYYNKLYGPGKWSRFLILNLAIGQGELVVTPLQLAQFFCGLANEGKVYKPHLLKEMLFPDGSKIEYSPAVSFTLPFSRRTIKILNEGLFLVVQGERGTARAQRNDFYDICGKTGTAQNPHGEDHAWFVAFAPSENPEIVVVALVENAGHGSEAAAPLVGKILKYYFTKEIPLADVEETNNNSELF